MAFRTIRWLLLTLVLTLAASGCGGGAGHPASSPGYGGGGEAVTVSADSSGPPAPPEPMDEGSGDTLASGSTEMKANRAGPPPVQSPAPAKMRMEEAEATRAVPPREAKPSAPDVPKTPATQLLIYMADLRVSVVDVTKSIDAVEKLAKDRGGYLVSREDNRITVRVPTAQFDAALAALGKLGDVLQRNVSVQDVTDLYFDLETRMKNLEVVRKRLDELLAKANTVTEALAVQRELERVNGELERLKGKLKLIRELVAFSTITVDFQPRNSEHIDNRVRLPFPWMDRLGLGDLMRLD